MTGRPEGEFGGKCGNCGVGVSVADLHTHHCVDPLDRVLQMRKRDGVKWRHADERPWNWMVHRINAQAMEQTLRKYARGTLVDIGCGKKPYAEMTHELVDRHIGVDHPDTLHGLDSIDVVADAYDTTLPNASADTVLSTTVMEHLERPQDAMNEMARILKPGGHLILSVPLFWHLHEEPRDFFRYTKYGIAHLMRSSGLEVAEIQPLSGFVVMAAAEFCYWLEAITFPTPLARIAQSIAQNGGWFLHRRGWDRTEAFTWLYIAVGRKP